MQQALRDLDQAYRNFFDSLSGKRKGPKIGEPRFKSKRDNRQTARYTKSDRWAITPDGKLRLPKVGDVPVRWSRELPSDPSSVTVVKDAAGRYFASFVVQTDPSEALPETTGEVGEHGLRRTAWGELALVDHWRRYLADPGAYPRHVLD
ncbi:RNA-guided endonuclease InsQ/TnpB family protein [Streptomyces mangrovi]|uniref:RNA-guided endonuclease InsQ/TnpB family protein n=1 Tax=Streptomyces mangrovi TaxID=1206892 RepID=UPI00399D5531